VAGDGGSAETRRTNATAVPSKTYSLCFPASCVPQLLHHCCASALSRAHRRICIGGAPVVVLDFGWDGCIQSYVTRAQIVEHPRVSVNYTRCAGLLVASHCIQPMVCLLGTGVGARSLLVHPRARTVPLFTHPSAPVVHGVGGPAKEGAADWV